MNKKEKVVKLNVKELLNNLYVVSNVMFIFL